MGKYIPTLSVQGWVDDPVRKGDYALGTFFTSEYSQSVLYAGSVASLPWIVKMYSNDPRQLESEVQSQLDTLMKNYFPSGADVVCVVDESSDNPGQLTIRVSVDYTEDGIDYSLGRRIEFFDGVMKRVIAENNG